MPARPCLQRNLEYLSLWKSCWCAPHQAHSSGRMILPRYPDFGCQNSRFSALYSDLIDYGCFPSCLTIYLGPSSQVFSLISHPCLKLCSPCTDGTNASYFYALSIFPDSLIYHPLSGFWASAKFWFDQFGRLVSRASRTLWILSNSPHWRFLWFFSASEKY